MKPLIFGMNLYLFLPCDLWKKILPIILAMNKFSEKETNFIDANRLHSKKNLTAGELVS